MKVITILQFSPVPAYFAMARGNQRYDPVCFLRLHMFSFAQLSQLLHKFCACLGTACTYTFGT